MAELERFTATDRPALREWLAEHARTSPGVWVVYAKGDDRTLGYDDIVEEALCVGWVDSLPRRLDDQHAMLRLTPRNPRSNWSRRNKERIASLRERGLMTAEGEAVVAAAVASGTWSALDQVEELTEPPGLRSALDADPVARANWDAFPRSARRAILEWLLSAKTEATRDRRVETIVAEAHQNRRANQWRQPGSPPPAR
ncbi:YdeI family protein [Leifsonia sp. EB34]|uniref:YdeI/OmpD-associated family protein n=1 Tax=Leifsonia sp. EB34 TaxID=3156303 RepID=UPI003518A7DF